MLLSIALSEKEVVEVQIQQNSIWTSKWNSYLRFSKVELHYNRQNISENTTPQKLIDPKTLDMYQPESREYKKMSR